MKIGELDVPNAIINLEHDVNVLQQFIDHIVKNNNRNLTLPTTEDVEKFRGNAIKMLQEKYPSMGIAKK